MLNVLAEKRMESASSFGKSSGVDWPQGTINNRSDNKLQCSDFYFFARDQLEIRAKAIEALELIHGRVILFCDAEKRVALLDRVIFDLAGSACVCRLFIRSRLGCFC